MADPVGTAIAFSALGANVLATGLLLLFNPRNLEVRWYTSFLTMISVWLLALGVLGATGARESAWAYVYAGAVFALPGLFLASTLAQTLSALRWARWAVVGLTVVAVPTGSLAMTRDVPLLVAIAALTWQVLCWGGASFLQWWDSRGWPVASERARAHKIINALLVFPGVVVAGAMLMGGDRFFTYVMPLLIFVIHGIIFTGVVWFRFYDIEVRAARSGELAGAALEAERLVAVGELAASVAHEVRNPLTGVRSLAQRMAEEDVDPERWRRYSMVIMEEIGRVDRIVGNLLAVARRAPEPAVEAAGPTELATLFDDLLLLTSARAERAGVRLTAEAGGLSASAPREPLAQVLLNLLLNGIRHTPAGRAVALAAARDGGGVAITVRDGGPGIPPDERDRIFEPFRTAGTDGSGLGLSVVRRIAGDRGWTVTVDDAPGGGAELRVLVPDGEAPA